MCKILNFKKEHINQLQVPIELILIYFLKKIDLETYATINQLEIDKINNYKKSKKTLDGFREIISDIEVEVIGVEINLEPKDSTAECFLKGRIEWDFFFTGPNKISFDIKNNNEKYTIFNIKQLIKQKTGT